MAGNTVKEMTMNFEKLDKFEGHDFSHLRIEESLRAQDSDKGKGKEVGGLLLVVRTNIINKTKVKSDPMRTTVVLVPTRNQSWNVGSVVRLVTSNGIVEVVKRTMQMLVVWERGLRTNLKSKVDAIAQWIDSGATTHVCKDRCWFKTYESVKDGFVLFMGDDHFAPVHGKGSVALEFSSRKTITLFNVLYVPKLCKNLVSGPMLNKCGYKQVYESDKYILSKSGVFVGFGYYNNGHVHYKRILDMSKDDLIHAIDENPEKCTTYDASRFFYVYLLHAKDEALDKFRICKTEVELQQNDLVKTLRTDKGESRDEIFNGNHLSSTPRPKDIMPNSDESQRDDLYDNVPNEILEPRKGKRDPRTYNEAMQSRDSAFWKEAIDDEIGSIMENNTWVLSDLPPSFKPLGCKWIFKRKMKVDGTFDKFKARLVIQGFRQKERIDYFDTYALVACITIIRLLLALQAIHNLMIHQMDVKTRFLNGDLDEKVYMKQLEGFIMPGNEHKTGHWKGITRVFKYLRGTKDYGLSYVGYPSVLEGYLDASWINHVEDSSSTSGWVFLLGGGVISWASKKQTCITSSTIESEFIALAVAGKEAEWLRNLIHEIPIWPKPIELISI
nr:zinc finger, CCHC-type [Tanacetum cinerariifolium]